jgi:hypothetical protein
VQVGQYAAILPHLHQLKARATLGIEAGRELSAGEMRHGWCNFTCFVTVSEPSTRPGNAGSLTGRVALPTAPFSSTRTACQADQNHPHLCRGHPLSST